MKTYCIYHNKDLDGFTSGAIVKHKLPEAILIGYDYGNPVEMLLEQLEPDSNVIMVDVSLPMDDMLYIATHMVFTWIDHHQSAINDYIKFNEENNTVLNEIKGVWRSGIAACELCWQYFFPGQPIPKAVTLLGEYDTWRNEDKNRWDNEILPFQFGMRNLCISPESFPTYLFFNNQDDVVEIIRQGLAILNYQRQQNVRAMHASFEVEFEGLTAIAVNAGGLNSEAFKSVFDPQKHRLMMPFVWTGRHWKVSIYSSDPTVDCSALAKKYGGGGHKGAAGFQIKNISLIFPSLTI